MEFLSLTGGCTGSSESTLVKMSNCWKSRAAAHMLVYVSKTCKTTPVCECQKLPHVTFNEIPDAKITTAQLQCHSYAVTQGYKLQSYVNTSYNCIKPRPDFLL